MARVFTGFLMLAAAFLLPAAAHAQQAGGNVATSPLTTATLVSEQASVRPGTVVWLALHLKIKPGWHTYWRNPGDSGAPTHLKWTLPEGWRARGIVWPAPEHHRVGHLMNYGYSDEAIHLVPVLVPSSAEAGKTATLKVHGHWLTCEKICVPEEGRFTVSIYVSKSLATKNSQYSAWFARARQRTPKDSPWKARFSVTGKTAVLTLEGASLKKDRVAQVWFYPFKPGVIDHAGNQVPVFADGRLQLRLVALKETGGLKSMDGVLVITEKLDTGEVRQAFVVRARPGPGGGAAGAAGAGSGGGGSGTGSGGTDTAGSPGGEAGSLGDVSFWTALLFAFLGGLILNLMPCVLPVLSLKALGFAQHARTDAGHLRAHGWAYTFGVLATFGIVTAVLVALRLAGQQIGWGFQLQSPLVIMLLAWLMVVIGLYFAGLFELGGRLAGVGSSLAERSGLSGSFFTGALAVVVASPCTVPFMSVAMGFAFTQPWPVTVATMMALGFGMALPFLLLSHAPALLRFIPKPGPWMVRFRQFLAFPMFATAVWLVWVVSRQAGETALIATLSGATLIAFAIWALKASGGSGRGWQATALAAAVLSLFVTGALAQYSLTEDAGPRNVAGKSDEGIPLFTPARLAEARAKGQAVFVNYTADWCVTCLVNEKRVLSGAWFTRAVKAANVVYMKGDWTRRDPAITKELEKFKRLGVPLYVFYPATGSRLKPEVLPQILTEDRVRAALEKFGRDAKALADKSTQKQ